VKISKTFKTSYRKLKKRIGRNRAIIAMARKLAVVIYNMLAGNQDFVDLDALQSLYNGKVGKMQSIAKDVQKVDRETVKRLIDEGVIKLESNKPLS
jgi:hypothetical protein